MDTLTTRQDILACFRLLLRRDPDNEELLSHFSLVGQPLRLVVPGYLQSAEYRALAQPFFEAEAVALDGFTIYVAKDDPLIAPAIRAGYEPEVTVVFTEHIGSGAVIDIGANCGYFSLLAASRGAGVYAIEPIENNV